MTFTPVTLCFLTRESAGVPQVLPGLTKTGFARAKGGGPARRRGTGFPPCRPGLSPGIPRLPRGPLGQHSAALRPSALLRAG